MELVSIIVPIYNMEEYVSICVESILNQTYLAIEIILVDDGSIDSTGRICDEYEKKYSNIIQVIHKKNEGVSAARNEALKKAKGKYIFFIDADDYYAPDFVEKMVEVDPKFDYVAGGYIQKSIDTQEERYIQCPECELTKRELKTTYKGEQQTIPLICVWGKRYKTEIIRKYGIIFDQNYKLGEDIRFNLQYLEHVNCMKGMSYSGIYHVYNDKSAMSKLYLDKLENLETECKSLENYLDIGERINQFKWYYWNIALEHYKKHHINGNITKIKYKKMKKKVYSNRYFRGCLRWIINNGTLDMKIQGICIKLHIQKIYPVIMKIVVYIYNKKNK